MIDSGASIHVTHDNSYFVSTESLDHPMIITTVSSMVTCTTMETIMFRYLRYKEGFTTVWISPVYYLPEGSANLLSMGEFFLDGMTSRGDRRVISILRKNGENFLDFRPRFTDPTTFIIRCEEPSREDADLFKIAPTVFSIDYETMHRRFGHPSPDVLKKAREHTLKFPYKVEFPTEIPICRGCAEGKMHSRSFPPTDRRASRAFELIHSDLKSFPVDSYHRYKYYILFLHTFQYLPQSYNISADVTL